MTDTTLPQLLAAIQTSADCGHAYPLAEPSSEVQCTRRCKQSTANDVERTFLSWGRQKQIHRKEGAPTAWKLRRREPLASGKLKTSPG